MTALLSSRGHVHMKPPRQRNDRITTQELLPLLLRARFYLQQSESLADLQWLNNELVGYEANVPLPPYRTVHAKVSGDAVDTRDARKRALINHFCHLEVASRFLKVQIALPILELERHVNLERHLRVPIPSRTVLDIHISHPKYRVLRAWWQVSPGTLAGLLQNVRTEIDTRLPPQWPTIDLSDNFPAPALDSSIVSSSNSLANSEH